MAKKNNNSNNQKKTKIEKKSKIISHLIEYTHIMYVITPIALRNRRIIFIL